MSNWASALDDANHKRGEFAFPDPESLNGDCENLHANLENLNNAANLWNQRRNQGNDKEKANAGAIFGILRTWIDHYTVVISRDCSDVQSNNEQQSNPPDTNTSNTVVLTSNPPDKASEIVNSNTQPVSQTPVEMSANKNNWTKQLPYALWGLAAVALIGFFISKKQ